MVLFCLTLTHSCFLRECSRVVREVMYSDAQQRQSLAALSLSLCRCQVMLSVPSVLVCSAGAGGGSLPTGSSAALPGCAACTACLRV